MKKLNKTLLELYHDRKQILFVSFLGYISYLTKDIIPSDPNISYATWGFVAVGGAMLTVGIIQGVMGNKAANKAADAADANTALTGQIAADQLAFQKEQQKKLDAQKDIYRAMEFKNPYENMENHYENMQNVYEDLTVNQQQAQFQSQQGDQQRANIMQGLRGAAGGSGIASLAQAMANQGQLQTQQISASIGQQEAMNQRMIARGAESVQKSKLDAEAAGDLQERAGEASLQTMEMDRQATLLGISMGESAGANAAAMQAQSNQLAAGAAQTNMYGQQAASFYGAAGDSFSAAGTAGMGAAGTL